MEIQGDREARATYFLLRMALIGTSFLVMAAPIAVWAFGDGLPPSISDSWYTDAQAIFVVGLAAGAFLLIVVRGDTLTEQTLLNLAGGLGMIVAAAACWPKDEDGNALPAYDPAVATHNRYAVWALLVVGLTGWVIANWLLPDEMVGTGWNTRPVARWVLLLTYPTAIVVVAAAMIAKPDTVAERIHGVTATVMFLLLAVVAFLRTRWGVGLLKRIGDTPVGSTISHAKLGTEGTSPYDLVYVTVAAAMAGVVTAAVVLTLNEAPPGWTIVVEFALLLLFGAFWFTETWEAWRATRGTSRVPAGQVGIA